jgi:hypothetical protein
LTYSQIASESQTTRSSCRSTGTQRVGDSAPISALNRGESSGSRCSTKSTSKWRHNNQGRSDHDE